MSGGSTMYPGIPERLEKEVKNIASSGTLKISKWTSTLNKALYVSH